MPDAVHEDDDAAVPRRVAVARLVVALVQGAVLLWLYRTVHPWTTARPDAALFAALAFVGCAVPVAVQFGLGRLRPVTLIIWAIVAALVLAGLTVHDVLRLPAAARHPTPSGELAFYGSAMLFMAHALVTAGDAARRVVPDYRTYFEVAWTLAIRLVLAFLFVGLFWLLLLAGAEMFHLIGLDFLRRLMRHDWFGIPVTALMLGAGIHLTDLRENVVRAVRVLVLNLLSWLLPVMAVLAVGFLAALPFAGLPRLWSVHRVTASLLVACAALVVLANAAFQDGRKDAPGQRILRLPTRVAALVLAPLVALAAYGLWLRVDQHGLTPDRIGAAACLIAAAVYAVGYAAAALWPARWVGTVARANVAAAFVAIALILALFSPAADPARLSVADQMHRLEGGKVSPDAFDFAFLHWHGARYGEAALRRLASQAGPGAAWARDALAGKTISAPPTPPLTQLAAQIAVRPPGRTLPDDFLRQDWTKQGREAPPCLRDPTHCTALLVDLDGDGTDEVVLNFRYRADVYRRSPAGWTLVGDLAGAYCSGASDAFRTAPFGAVASEWRDLEVGGRRYRVNPSQSCK
jgi:hypothetical protein